MMARRSLLTRVLAALAVAPLGGCIYHYTCRYRLTLFVETPEGVKIGSGVIENRWVRNDMGIPRSYVASKDRGEATVADLGARGLLFALLAKRYPNGSVDSSGDYAHYLPLQAFERRGLIKVVYGELGAEMKQLEQLRASAELTREEIPFLVRFRDINDPKTVEAVDPNDLEKSFGPGVKLKRATIEMTGDPVTTGIEKRLGWLARLKGGYLDGQFAGGGPALSNMLHGGNFKKGGE